MKMWLPKRAFHTRHSHKTKMRTPKTSVSHKTFPENDSMGFQNERFARDIPRKWQYGLPKWAFHTRHSQNGKILPARGATKPMNMSHSSRQPSRRTKFVISPAFRAFDTHDLCRGLPVPNRKRNLTCISRLRHARSRQRVAPDRTKTQSHLHFAPSTRTISAEGCARQIQNEISPAFRAFDTHDLRRRLTFAMLRRHHPRLKRE